jgi:hypothetical protein
MTQLPETGCAMFNDCGFWFGHMCILSLMKVAPPALSYTNDLETIFF